MSVLVIRCDYKKHNNIKGSKAYGHEPKGVLIFVLILNAASQASHRNPNMVPEVTGFDLAHSELQDQNLVLGTWFKKK